MGQVIDTDTHSKRPLLEQAFYILRQHKGITKAAAVKAVSDPLTYANLLVHCGLADGCVAGADATTADVVCPSDVVCRSVIGSSSCQFCFTCCFLIRSNSHLTANRLNDQFQELVVIDARCEQVRSAIQIVGMRDDCTTISSFFLMCFKQPVHGRTALIFSDCGYPHQSRCQYQYSPTATASTSTSATTTTTATTSTTAATTTTSTATTAAWFFLVSLCGY